MPSKKKSEPKLVASETFEVGHVFQVDTEDDSVEVMRPDQNVVTVAAFGGRALHVLDVPGFYLFGELVVEAK